MALSLKIDFPIHPFRIIEPDSKVLLVGSCFTENIGVLLKSGGMDVNINPFGILFNPLSISKAILRISNNALYTEADLFQNHEGRFVSFDHHGRYSGYKMSDVLESINSSIQFSHDFLKKADCLIVTLGSAWIYRLVKNKQVVANCHKVPAKEFYKSMLGVTEIYDALNDIVKELGKINPDLSMIFTISPVKHLRDGIIENTQSKSALVLACRQLMELKVRGVYYFPAFEIVNEELRDYRFYEADHAHPNSLAISYLWERFSETCFKDSTLQMVKDSQQLVKALEHISLHENSERNLSLENKIKDYLKKYSK